MQFGPGSVDIGNVKFGIEFDCFVAIFQSQSEMIGAMKLTVSYSKTNYKKRQLQVFYLNMEKDNGMNTKQLQNIYLMKY